VKAPSSSQAVGYQEPSLTVQFIPAQGPPLPHVTVLRAVGVPGLFALTAPVGSLSRQTAAPLAANATATATLTSVRSYLRTLQAACSPTATLAALRTVRVTLQASSASLTSLLRLIGKSLSVSTHPVPTETSVPPPPDNIMATPVIDRLRPITRQQGIQIPDIVSGSRWIDAVALSANTAASYTLPTDAAGQKATLLRVSSTAGPIYLNWNGTATIPTSVSDGTASAIIHSDLEGVFVAAPLSSDTLSLICASTSKVTIEAWS
jgi:hypothetical protein